MIGVPEEEEREQGIETLFEEIMTENFPPGKGIRHTSSGSTKSSKQDEFKQTHTKIHHN